MPAYPGSRENEKTRVTVVTAWYAPYRLPLYRGLANTEAIDLTVIFCSPVETGRNWGLPGEFPFKAVFLESRTVAKYVYRNVFGDTNIMKYPIGLFSALNELKPDVVVCYEFHIECIMAALYCRIKGCSYVTWSDTTELLDSRIGRIRKLFRKRLLAMSDALIGSCSDTINHFTKNYSYPAESSFLSILSSHVDDFAARLLERPKPVPRSDCTTRFLYIGQLIKRKGLDLLLHAFAALRSRSANVVLTIVGDGQEYDALLALSTSLGCGDSVVFKQSVPYDQVADEMALHDVFVFPTRLDVFGLVIAEAVACGLPVICSCWAGAAGDLVADNGMVVNPENHQELIRALETLANDAALRLKMHNACRKVLEQYNAQSAVAGFALAVTSAAAACAARVGNPCRDV